MSDGSFGRGPSPYSQRREAHLAGGGPGADMVAGASGVSGTGGHPDPGPKGEAVALYVLANEYDMMTTNALDLCEHVGIPAESAGSMVTAADAARFRLLAASASGAREAPVPQRQPSPRDTLPLASSAGASFAGPSWAVPAAASSAPEPAPAPAPTPAPFAGPSWAVPDTGARPAPAATSGPVGPTAAPGTAAPWTNPPGPSGAASWAVGAPPAGMTAPGAASGFGPPGSGPAGPVAPGFAPPGLGAPGFGAPAGGLGEGAALQATIAQAREAANKMLLSGVGAIGLAILITVGTWIIAPGGFFLVAFGPVIYGVRQIGAGTQRLDQVKKLERQARAGAPPGPGSAGPAGWQ